MYLFIVGYLLKSSKNQGIAKLYGSRGGRKVKKAIQNSIQELENERDEGIENNNTSSIV